MEQATIARVVAVVVGLVGISAVARSGPIEEALDKARTDYWSGVDRAKKAYLAKADERLKKAADAGNLDTVLQIRADKKAFETRNTEPVAGLLKGPYVDYLEALKLARKKMNDGYEAAVKEYTRTLDTDRAGAVRAEQAAFKTTDFVPGVPVWPEIRAPIGGDIKMIFCWVPAGKAVLGAPAGEKGRSAQEPEHEFATPGFWLRKYELTQMEFAQLMGTNPSTFDGKKENTAKGKDTSRFPVEGVSWDDCRVFLKKLNAIPEAARAFPAKGTFALPTEDEWEYACRGGKGNTTPYYFGGELNGRQANSDGRAPHGIDEAGPYLARPTEIGTYAKAFPHPWGLCDMHGNVWEYCESSQKLPKDARVIRGGCYWSSGDSCRAAHRLYAIPETPRYTIGFRICFRPE